MVVMTPRIPSPLPHGATAVRPQWADLPQDVRALVEKHLGAPVVTSVSQGSGFTAGFASRLLSADGGRAFVKAVSRADSPVIHACYADEARIVTNLPEAVPAPRLRFCEPVGDWLVLAFDDVAGRPPARPWQMHELARVLDALSDLAAALTPPPAGVRLPTLQDIERDELCVWRGLAGGGEDVADPFAAWASWIPDLAALESGWRAAAGGQTIVHFDMRDDNVILADDGRVFVVDWNWPSVGAPWLDLVALLIGAYGDGLDVERVLAEHPLSREVPADAVDSWLAALAGVWVERSARPGPPSSPWLRTHQRWYAETTLMWLAQRRGWV